jgi:hypothetical protein
MEPVVEMLVKGKKPGEIARRLKLTIPEVNRIANEWRSLASDDQAVRARAKQVVAGADAHFGDLIQTAYEVIEAIDEEMSSAGVTAALLAQKNSGIKVIADLEVKRFNMLRDLGVLTNQEEADGYAQMEQDHEVLMGILREVVMKCPNCQNEVARRLAMVTGKAEVIVVNHA